MTGKAAECNDIKMKQKMLEECPVLSKHSSSAEVEHYLLFQVDVLNTEFSLNRDLSGHIIRSII